MRKKLQLFLDILSGKILLPVGLKNKDGETFVRRIKRAFFMLTALLFVQGQPLFASGTGSGTTGSVTCYLTVTIKKTNVTCSYSSDGTATAKPAKGALPYDYLWSNGETTASITGLIKGIYTVTVTDANGCSKTVKCSVGAPAPIKIVISQSNIKCKGEHNGFLSAHVSGGSGTGYKYHWSNGETTASINGLNKGTYTLIVKDSKGCSATIVRKITEPARVLALTFSKSTCSLCYPNCNGSVTANPTGGTVPYYYEWSTGEHTKKISGLCAGTFVVTVTDKNGCTVTKQIVLAASCCDIAVVPTISDNTNCLPCNGSISLFTTGGSGDYLYTWSTGDITNDGELFGLCAGSYDVTVTDLNSPSCTKTITGLQVNDDIQVIPELTFNIGNNCPGGNTGSIEIEGLDTYGYLVSFEWSNGESTNPLTDLATGSYTVTITSSNGCSALYTDLAVEDKSPPDIFPTFIYCHDSCTGGGSIINDADYTDFLWSNGETTVSVTNLCFGKNWVTVTDIDGCQITAELELDNPEAIVASCNVVNDETYPGSFDGSLQATATGGFEPLNYTLLWNDGQETEIATGLGAGIYTVTVTDEHGCTATTSCSVADSFPNPNPPPNDDCSGAIAVPVSVNLDACVMTTSTSTVNATGATYSSACFSISYDDDIWYSFEADTTSINILITNLSNTTNGNTIDWSLFDACGGNELYCTLQTEGDVIAIDNLVPGTTYFLSMFYNLTDDRGTFDFCLYKNSYNVPPPPINDDCSNAIHVDIASDLSSCVMNNSTSTVGATNSFITSSCWFLSIDDDIWYSFVADSETISLLINNINTAPSNIDIAWAVFDACGGNEVACGNNYSDDIVDINNLTPGSTYYISLFTDGVSDRGTFDFCLFKNPLPPAPVNDDCINATPVSVAADINLCSYTNVTIPSSAAGSTFNSGCWLSPSVNDVWYSFQPDTEAISILFSNIITHPGQQPVGWSVFDACGGNEVACLYNYDGEIADIVGLTRGSIYYISMHLEGNNYGSNFDFCLYKNPPFIRGTVQQRLAVATSVQESSGIYPNPFYDGFTARYSGNELFNVTITDISGRLVEYHSAISKQVDLGHGLSPGSYTVKIESVNGYKSTTRVMKIN